MAVVFDSSTLLLVLQPTATPPIDPATGKPLEHAVERVEYLIRQLSRAKTKVLIPTPVLSEVLVHAGAASTQYLTLLNQSPFRIVPFDTRAAINCAESIRSFKLKGQTGGVRNKLKFDRQIVSIAQVENVEALYSDDGEMFRFGQQVGVKVVRTYELPRDPEAAQGKLDLTDRTDHPDLPNHPDAGNY